MMSGSEIGFYSVCVDIIIPLLSALIGGFVTMLGVILTIKHEQKKAAEQRKQDAKPWLFSMDDKENFDCKKANDIILMADATMEGRAGLCILIKNTDNGVGIIEKLQTKDNTYLPTVGRILDKNSISYVHFFFAPHETLTDMYLYISDVYGNKYMYRVEQDACKKACTITEVTSSQG